MWQYWSTNGTGGIISGLYNPATGAVTTLPNPTPVADYFCGGENQLPDGRILIDGGLDGPQGEGDKGIKGSVIFDPATTSWQTNASMTYPRYYPTNLVLGNGMDLVFSGFNGNGTGIIREVEQYDDVNVAWTTLPTSANLPAGTWEPYPRFFLLPTGSVFSAGPTQASWFLDPATYKWSYGPSMQYPNRHGEGAVLLPDLKTVFAFGGQNDLDNQKVNPTYTIESADTSLGSNGVWTYGKSMHYARHDLNAVELPDQTILIVGGAGGASKYENPVEQAEQYDPANATWKILAAQQGQRGYHSTAILLPDGTVFSAGSDSGNSLQTYGEIFSPPYLFKGARPTITSAPTALTYGANFTVTTPNASTITSVVLIRNDADTHATHFDQRIIPLAFTIGSGQLTVTAPVDGNTAPPGYYMLFIVNSTNVPSVAPMVNLPEPTS